MPWFPPVLRLQTQKYPLLFDFAKKQKLLNVMRNESVLRPPRQLAVPACALRGRALSSVTVVEPGAVPLALARSAPAPGHGVSSIFRSSVSRQARSLSSSA